MEQGIRNLRTEKPGNLNYGNYSPDGYACYIRYNFGQALNSSFALGHIGRTLYGGQRSQC
jgi:hypothetical protein